MDHLDLEDLFDLTRRVGAGPVRDPGLLGSAVARPRTSLFGEDAYPTLALKAATLLHSIASSHALADGNKRPALLAAVTFVRLNGGSFTLRQDEAFDLIMAVADGTIDVPEIAARLSTTLEA